MSKRTPITILAAILALTSLASANGLNLNGLGTRSQAMGGAFVGIADDFSAVFWNPAGAANFRQTTFGAYAVDLIPRATYRLQCADQLSRGLSQSTPRRRSPTISAGWPPITSRSAPGSSSASVSARPRVSGRCGTARISSTTTGRDGLRPVEQGRRLLLVAAHRREAQRVAVRRGHAQHQQRQLQPQDAGRSRRPGRGDGRPGAVRGEHERLGLRGDLRRAGQARRQARHRPDRADPVDRLLQGLGPDVLPLPLRPAPTRPISRARSPGRCGSPAACRSGRSSACS